MSPALAGRFFCHWATGEAHSNALHKGHEIKTFLCSKNKTKQNKKTFPPNPCPQFNLNCKDFPAVKELQRFFWSKRSPVSERQDVSIWGTSQPGTWPPPFWSPGVLNGSLIGRTCSPYRWSISRQLWVGATPLESQPACSFVSGLPCAHIMQNHFVMAWMGRKLTVKKESANR